MAGRANPFDWSGGDPALDFVNTLDERPSGAAVENLATYRDLVRFAALAGLIEASASHRLRSLKGPNCFRIARRARELEGTPVRDPGRGPRRQDRAQNLAGCDCIGSAPGSRRASACRNGDIKRGQARLDLAILAGNSAARLRARHRIPARGGRSQPYPKVRRIRLRGVFHRYKQGASTAVVQHAELRQSRKTKALAFGGGLTQSRRVGKGASAPCPPFF